MNTTPLTDEFWQHVEELRQTLVKSLAVIGLSTALCMTFFSWLYPVIISPLNEQGLLKKSAILNERYTNESSHEALIQKPEQPIVFLSDGVRLTSGNIIAIPPKGYIDIEIAKRRPSLIILGPLEGVTATLKISLWLGIALSFPIWGFFVLAFILPALKQDEKKFIIPFALGSVLVVFFAGFTAIKGLIPAINQILHSLNSQLGTNLWSVSYYLNYTLMMSLSMVIASELILGLFFLVHYGKISAGSMSRWRPAVIVGTFVISALLTPPDIVTQLILAVPLACIYECAIVYAKIRNSYVLLTWTRSRLSKSSR